MPDLSWFPSGAGSIWSDAKHFLTEVRFARPGLLWLSTLPTAISLAAILIAWRSRAVAAAIGRSEAVYALFTRPHSARRLRPLALFFAWACFILGAAGPRWGKGSEEGIVAGRDIVLVLDLSRSMTADDMLPPAKSRREAAIAAGRELIGGMRENGGHRVALVVFAAKPKVIVPLTTDLDHVTMMLAEMELLEDPPAETRIADEGVSGTRIGAALELAVSICDSRFRGFQDIILLSDGDDPAADREWVRGINAARTTAIPVHTVGFGDREALTPLSLQGMPFEYEKPGGLRDVVQTKLHEEVLREIQEQTFGMYVPSERGVPKLGDFFQTRIEPLGKRRLDDDLLPQEKDRSAWFLGIGAALLLMGWILEG